MNSALKFFLLFAGLVVAGFLLFGIGGARRTVMVAPVPAVQGPAPVSPRMAPLARATPDPRAPRSASLPPKVVTGNLQAPVAEEGLVITNWEEAIEPVLTNHATADIAKASRLLELFPSLPEEGQEACAQHLSNLVSDEYYPFLGSLLTNAALPEAVLDVLMSDVLNRPNAIKLPALLALARDSTHPKAPEARDILELQLDMDYGEDWALWEQRLQQWLQTEQAQEGQMQPPAFPIDSTTSAPSPQPPQ